MEEVTAHRRLVKSPPELWAEISDAEAMARRLGEFGEIRITDTRPETTVAWEGERARGTVEIESSGWGTRVVLTARPEVGPAPEPPAPAPAPPPPPPPPERVERELRTIGRERVRVEVPAPAPEPPPDAAPEPGSQATLAPEPAGEPAQEPRRGFFARLFGRPRPQEPEPGAPEPAPAPPQPPPPPDVVAFTIFHCAVASRVPPRRAAAPPPPPPEPAPAVAPERVREVLEGVLDDLGTAHHRPFSRS